MLINLLGLKTLDIIIMFIGCPRRYMGLSKPQELGMSAFGISLLRRALPLGRSTPHYSPRSLMGISSFVKYMLMISSLDRIWWIDVEGVQDVNDWWAYILSWFSSQANERRDFYLSRKIYKDLLKRFNMDECKPIKTPMLSNGHLNLDEGGKMVDQTLYRSMIGSLLYLIASRPDIMFSVCMCARF